MRFLDISNYLASCTCSYAQFLKAYGCDIKEFFHMNGLIPMKNYLIPSLQGVAYFKVTLKP